MRPVYVSILVTAFLLVHVKGFTQCAIEDQIIDQPITTATDIQAYSEIIASSTVSGSVNVNFKAGDRITLKDGFHVSENGGTFTVKLDECPGYYWVGGSGNWSDYSNHWATSSGGNTFHTSVPTSTDDVYFDENSFSSSSSVTVDTQADMGSLSMNRIDENATLMISAIYGLNIYGSINLNASASISGATGIVYMKSTNAGNTIRVDGTLAIRALDFRGGGDWSLLSDLTIYNNNITPDYGTLWVTSGSLYTNNYDITIGALIGTVTTGNAEIHLGSSTLTMKDGVIANNYSPDRTKVFAQNATVIIIGGQQRVMFFDNISANEYHRLEVSDLFIFTIDSDIVVDELVLKTSAAVGKLEIDTLFLEENEDYFIRQTDPITINHGIKGDSFSLKSSSLVDSATVNMPSVDLCFENIDLELINAVGTANYYAALNSTDLGGNDGWNFVTGTCEDNLSLEVESLLSRALLNQEDEAPFHIFPNPVSSHLNIVPNQNSEFPTLMKLYDLTGSLVLEQLLNGGNVVNISSVPNGIYRLLLQDQQLHSFTIIVNH